MRAVQLRVYEPMDARQSQLQLLAPAEEGGCPCMLPPHLRQLHLRAQRRGKCCAPLLPRAAAPLPWLPVQPPAADRRRLAAASAPRSRCGPRRCELERGCRPKAQRASRTAAGCDAGSAAAQTRAQHHIAPWSALGATAPPVPMVAVSLQCTWQRAEHRGAARASLAGESWRCVCSGAGCSSSSLRSVKQPRRRCGAHVSREAALLVVRSPYRRPERAAATAPARIAARLPRSVPPCAAVSGPSFGRALRACLYTCGGGSAV